MKHVFAYSILLAAAGIAGAADIIPVHHKHNLPACEPGYQWVEETCYKEVCRYECKMVPDVIKHKKWGYSCKEDPFCIKQSATCLGCLFGGLGHSHKSCDTCGDKNCSGHGCSKASCPTCVGPNHRILLVKKEVFCEEPTVKCVVEKIVETVPYTVCKKVPCGTVAPTAPSTVVPAITPPPAQGETLLPPAQKLPK